MKIKIENDNNKITISNGKTKKEICDKITAKQIYECFDFDNKKENDDYELESLSENDQKNDKLNELHSLFEKIILELNKSKA